MKRSPAWGVSVQSSPPKPQNTSVPAVALLLKSSALLLLPTTKLAPVKVEPVKVTASCWHLAFGEAAWATELTISTPRAIVVNNSSDRLMGLFLLVYGA